MGESYAEKRVNSTEGLGKKIYRAGNVDIAQHTEKRQDRVRIPLIRGKSGRGEN